LLLLMLMLMLLPALPSLPTCSHCCLPCQVEPSSHPRGQGPVTGPSQLVGPKVNATTAQIHQTENLSKNQYRNLYEKLISRTDDSLHITASNPPYTSAMLETSLQFTGSIEGSEAVRFQDSRRELRPHSNDVTAVRIVAAALSANWIMLPLSLSRSRSR
jgi:hypothetical protein